MIRQHAQWAGQSHKRHFHFRWATAFPFLRLLQVMNLTRWKPQRDAGTETSYFAPRHDHLPLLIYTTDGQPIRRQPFQQPDRLEKIEAVRLGEKPFFELLFSRR